MQTSYSSFPAATCGAVVETPSSVSLATDTAERTRESSASADDGAIASQKRYYDNVVQNTDR